MKKNFWVTVKAIAALMVLWYISYCAVDGILQKISQVFETDVFLSIPRWLASIIVCFVVICLTTYIVKLTIITAKKKQKRRKQTSHETNDTQVLTREEFARLQRERVPKYSRRIKGNVVSVRLPYDVRVEDDAKTVE